MTGRGGRLTDLEALRPYVLAEDVIAVGFRAGDEYETEARAAGVRVVDAGAVVAWGAESVGGEVLSGVDRPQLDGFWIHLDVDVVDGSLMPAVDSPEPGGLDWQTLAALLTGLLAAPRVAGLQLTIYDPDLDPDGRYADALVDLIARVFHADSGD